MANLRFNVLVRRKGEPFHTSEKFAQEEYETLEELKEAINHFIDVEIEDEEEYSFRNEGEDESN